MTSPDPTRLVSALGPCLQTVREDLGVSTVELARAAGVDCGRINRIESGTEVPTVAWLHRVACGLTIPLSQLVRLAEEAALDDRLYCHIVRRAHPERSVAARERTRAGLDGPLHPSGASAA